MRGGGRGEGLGRGVRRGVVLWKLRNARFRNEF